jgi:uncharacterized protein (TIGR04255 family)
MSVTNNYKKNFLKNVIFRLDYSIILDLSENKPINFQKEIIDDFPILEPITQLGFQLEQQGEEMSAKNLKKTIWKFLSKDKLKSIELDQEYLSISIKNNTYTTFGEYRELVEKIITLFYNNYPSTIINRLGLRYINEIQINESDNFEWSNYLDDSLTGCFNFLEDKTKVKRVINSFITKVNDNSFLNFKYGIFNKHFPSEIVDKTFILDYDCYTREQLEKSDILPKIGLYNEVITEKFEKSIKKGLRDLLNN